MMDKTELTYETISGLSLEDVWQYIASLKLEETKLDEQQKQIREQGNNITSLLGVLESRRIALERGYGVEEGSWLLVTQSCESFLHAESMYVTSSDNYLNTICKAEDMFKHGGDYGWFVAGKFGYGNNPIFPDSLVVEMRDAFLKSEIDENDIESPRWTINGREKVILTESGKIDREQMEGAV